MIKANFASIQLETERLILRNLKQEDVSQDYVDWLNDPEFSKDLDCAGQSHSIEGCKQYVASYQDKKNVVLLGIFDREHVLHIGNITFSDVDWEEKSIGIGISVGRKSHKGKGFAKESLKEIIAYCFEGLQTNRLYATINVRNKKSVDLFKKCGFDIEKTIDGGSDGQDSYLVSMKRPG